MSCRNFAKRRLRVEANRAVTRPLFGGRFSQTQGQPGLLMSHKGLTVHRAFSQKMSFYHFLLRQ